MTNIEKAKIKNKSYILETIGNNFTGEFYQTLEEKLTPIFFKLLQKTEEVGTIHNSFCEGSIIPILKPNTTRKLLIIYKYKIIPWYT